MADVDAPLAPPTISVVVPVRNGTAYLARSIPALAATLAAGDEVIVVDDASDDGGLMTFDDPRVHLVALERHVGPGLARNLGAARARGDVLVFVDADVVVHDDTLARIRAAFADTTRSAVIGAYDDHPDAPGVVSQYRNLLHRYAHLTGGSTASHFWTGLGAVRRDVFESLGGLDEGRWRHAMEDVEFGHRLVDAGHEIRVDPEVCGTHLKRFSFGVMVRTDLIGRAIPWSRLLLSTRRSDDFVTTRAQKVSVVSSGALVAAVALTPWRPRSWALAVLASVAFTLANCDLWRYFRRVRSTGFAVACWPFHVVHSLVAGVGFAIALATPHRDGKPGPEAP